MVLVMSRSLLAVNSSSATTTKPNGNFLVRGTLGISSSSSSHTAIGNSLFIDTVNLFLPPTYAVEGCVERLRIFYPLTEQRKQENLSVLSKQVEELCRR
ncbi:hypothetical protein CPC08DRAFT_173284 [Agrocybe pediades]|nr:hypothetical protein CPC08DRAFT_173284 [Agrocybe pediades]